MNNLETYQFVLTNNAIRPHGYKFFLNKSNFPQDHSVRLIRLKILANREDQLLATCDCDSVLRSGSIYPRIPWFKRRWSYTVRVRVL